MLFLHEVDNTLDTLSGKFLTFVASVKQAKRLAKTFSPPAESMDVLDLLNAGLGELGRRTGLSYNIDIVMGNHGQDLQTGATRRALSTLPALIFWRHLQIRLNGGNRYIRSNVCHGMLNASTAIVF